MKNKLTQKQKFEKMEKLINNNSEIYFGILNSRVKYCFYKVLYGIGITINTNNGVDKRPIIERIKKDLFNIGLEYNNDDVNNVLDVVIRKRKFLMWELIW